MSFNSRIALYIRLALITSLVHLNACGEQSAAKQELVRPIAWQKVESHSMQQVRRISGIVQAAEETQLSFEVSGKVAKVNIKLGDRVKKGEILAQLDSASFDLNLRSAKAQLAQTKSRLIEAQNTFDRQNNIFKKGFGSKAAYDDAKAALEAAQSSVDATSASFELSQKSLGDTQLIAPYDGVVTSRFIEPSQQIAAGQPAIEFEGDKGLEISVLVPENLLKNIDKSQHYTANFPAIKNLSLKSKVIEIGSQAEAANAFQVTLSIETENKLLRAGMTAEVDFDFQGTGVITGHQGKVVYVPPTALLAGDKDLTYAFIYNPETQTVSRRVVLPENMIGNTVQVTQGLTEGEIVATAGVEYLYDGQKVRLLDQGPKVFN